MSRERAREQWAVAFCATREEWRAGYEREPAEAPALVDALDGEWGERIDTAVIA